MKLQDPLASANTLLICWNRLGDQTICQICVEKKHETTRGIALSRVSHRRMHRKKLLTIKNNAEGKPFSKLSTFTWRWPFVALIEPISWVSNDVMVWFIGWYRWYLKFGDHTIPVRFGKFRGTDYAVVRCQTSKGVSWFHRESRPDHISGLQQQMNTSRVAGAWYDF